MRVACTQWRPWVQEGGEPLHLPQPLGWIVGPSSHALPTPHRGSDFHAGWWHLQMSHMCDHQSLSAGANTECAQIRHQIIFSCHASFSDEKIATPWVRFPEGTVGPRMKDCPSFKTKLSEIFPLRANESLTTDQAYFKTTLSEIFPLRANESLTTYQHQVSRPCLLAF